MFFLLCSVGLKSILYPFVHFSQKCQIRALNWIVADFKLPERNFWKSVSDLMEWENRIILERDNFGIPKFNF